MGKVIMNRRRCRTLNCFGVSGLSEPVWSNEHHWNALHLEPAVQLRKIFQGRTYIDQGVLIAQSH